MTQTSPDTSRSVHPAEFTRRTVLTRAVAVGGVAALGGALAACGRDSGSGGSAGSAGSTTVNTADVPVGGGTIIPTAQVVVTQPSAGEFKAFNAVCTLQGCLVARVEQGAILCTCHNSRFSATDGSVQSGPASQALAARSVTVSGGTLTVS
jgi:nitrite reductase/ring-hydroxylating ferredoxin subunit